MDNKELDSAPITASAMDGVFMAESAKASLRTHSDAERQKLALALISNTSFRIQLKSSR